MLPLGDGNRKWTSGQVNVVKLEVQFVVTSLGRLVDHRNCAVVVVAEADLHLRWALHRKANATRDAGVLAVNRQLIVNAHLSGGHIGAGDLDLLGKLPVGGLVAGDVALKRRADNLSTLVLDVNFVHAAGLGRVRYIHAAVLV